MSAFTHPQEGLFLVSVFVDPAHRGAGLADRLLAEVLRWARSRPGATRMTLHVHEDNPRAQGFYRRWGFRDTGVRVPYNLDPTQNEVEMRVEFDEPGNARRGVRDRVRRTPRASPPRSASGRGCRGPVVPLLGPGELRRGWWPGVPPWRTGCARGPPRCTPSPPSRWCWSPPGPDHPGRDGAERQEVTESSLKNNVSVLKRAREPADARVVGDSQSRP
jgi:hypothetical protein